MVLARRVKTQGSHPKIGKNLVLIMQFKVMILKIPNPLLESDAYGREEKGLALPLPTAAYLSASLTAEFPPHFFEVKMAGLERLLWIIKEKIEFLRSEMAIKKIFETSE